MKWQQAQSFHDVGGNVEANAINAFKKPVNGIKKVFNPLPATGGEDPPTAAEAPEKGIQSTRVLGRLVSLPTSRSRHR